MDMLHDNVDVQVQHTINGGAIGINQIAADTDISIRMDNAEAVRLLKNAWKQGRTVPQIKQIHHKRDDRSAVPLAELAERCLVAVDHYGARSGGQHCFGTGMADT